MVASKQSKGLSLSSTPLVSTREVVLDSAPLLYFLLGIYSQRNGKGTHQVKTITDVPFTPEYVKLLLLVLSQKAKLVTSYVLAEMSNFAEKDVNIKHFLEEMKNVLLDLKEDYVPKEEMLTHESCFKFGLSDMSLLAIKNKERTLITTERPLEGKWKSEGMEAIHLYDLFQHYENLGLVEKD